MLVVNGVLLVLITWAIATFAVMSLGLLISAVSAPGANRAEVLRGALWWGLVVAAILAYAINFVAPLQSLRAGLIFLSAVAILGVPGWWMWWQRAPRRHSGGLWLAAAAGMMMLTLALAALGPVTNYDSGLYHLQAIRYAADYAAVPGLANVHFPLGYASAEFPLAALMGIGPWGFDGYRLINGFVILLALVDLVIRARTGRRGAGFYVLLTGIGVVVITMLTLADYWVTSPTQDSTVFVVTMVATAYLADVVTRSRWIPPGGVLVSLMVILLLIRPTMVGFAGGLLVVVALITWRRRAQVSGSQIAGLCGVTAAAAVIAGVVTAARDYLLSGWLFYPLSFFSFDVAWLSPDPTDSRNATLGAARSPEDLWEAAQGWGWVSGWFARLPSQWETYAFGLLTVTAILTLVLASRVTSLRVRGLLLTMAPSAAATVFWWAFTPPSFRFAWGAIFSLATIPIGWALWRLAQAHRLAVPSFAVTGGAVAVSVVAVITMTLLTDYASMTADRVWRFGLSVPFVVTPPRAGDVSTVVTSFGLEARVPRSGDQCWLAFPTCSPQLPGTLQLRGEDIQSGYLP